jgi:cytochrome oxidase Cu insertion factor (SCO1/SenC/PrrC family)
VLAGRVRLATVTFDPARSDWRFLTAASPAAIAPVLAAFGQDAVRLVGPDAEALGLYRHVLKVFLVDASGAVRNVYSSGFLSPDLVLTDARTVLAIAPAAVARTEDR